MGISINRKKGETFEPSSNWIPIENSPEVDEFILVIYMSYTNGIWEDYEVTVAKYDGWNWIDCLNLSNDLEPLYWRTLPGIMD